MALKDRQGRYYKVLLPEGHFKEIIFEVYENEAHRDQGETEFYKAKRISIPVSIGWDSAMLTYTLDNTLSIEDNLKTCLYGLAKSMEPYSGYEDY